MLNKIDREGVSYVNYTVSSELGYIFREQPSDDYGVDAHIEIIEDKYPTGKLIALQIKSGESYFKKERGENIIYRGEEKHLTYWTKHSLPVIIVLYNTITKECIWEQVKKENVSKSTKNYWEMLVPRNKILNKDFKKTLKILADNQSEYERRLNSLILSKPWMKEIDANNNVILEAEEWVNKSSGKGTLKLKVIDSLTFEERVDIEWSFVVFFPGQMYIDVFRKIFPWADIQIDEEFYEHYEVGRFTEEECPYDDEEEKYIYLGNEFFESWEKNQNKLRPYKNGAGEVDFYRLKLLLNDIGKTFLKLDTFLESIDFYPIINEENIN